MVDNATAVACNKPHWNQPFQMNVMMLYFKSGNDSSVGQMPGCQNTAADAESRVIHLDDEWSYIVQI